MIEFDPDDLPVTKEEVSDTLELLFPDTFERILMVLKGAKRNMFVDLSQAAAAEADEPEVD